jgi:ubiquinone/menaquinone biosynthesis C-methylase UbiE
LWDDFWKSDQNDNKRLWRDLMLDLSSKNFHEKYQEIGSGKKFIECGSGEGNMSYRMSRLGYHCTMLDYSELALQKAKVKFKNVSAKDKLFIKGDLNSLPIEDSTYDIVFSGGVLEYSNDLNKWISEMSRILKPGGIFSASIFPKKFSIQTLAHFLNTPISFLSKIHKKNYKGAFRIRTSFPENYPIKNYKVKDYIASLEKAGIKLIKSGGANPFFRIDLPVKSENAYAKFLTKRFSPFYNYFNSKDNLFTNTFGITYEFLGIKK